MALPSCSTKISGILSTTRDDTPGFAEMAYFGREVLGFLHHDFEDAFGCVENSCLGVLGICPCSWEHGRPVGFQRWSSTAPPKILHVSDRIFHGSSTIQRAGALG